MTEEQEIIASLKAFLAMPRNKRWMFETETVEHYVRKILAFILTQKSQIAELKKVTMFGSLKNDTPVEGKIE